MLNNVDKDDIHRFRQTNFLDLKLKIFSYPSVLTYVLGAQKNHLNETVLSSTHNILGAQKNHLNKTVLLSTHNIHFG